MTDLLEQLSDLEHQQWEYWSKTLSDEFKDIKSDLHIGDCMKSILKIDNRLLRWDKNWKPYNQLTEEVKEYDRVWARKIIELIKNKITEEIFCHRFCPECGHILELPHYCSQCKNGVACELQFTDDSIVEFLDKLGLIER